MVQIILLIVGIAGLVKGKIRVTSKRELRGPAVKKLSIFYLVMAAIPFFFGNIFEVNLAVLILVTIVTIAVVVSAKGQPTVA